MHKCRAFSYARFSDPSQAGGFSLARQLEAAKAYCDRRGWVLDERTFFDRGLSGFRGSNAKAGNLAEFIELVNAGRIPKESVLIVENTDRLTATAVSTRVNNARYDGPECVQPAA